MYRILIIVLLNVAFSLGCRPPPCHWNDPAPAVNYFNKVANKVINADRKAELFCQKQGSPNIKEIHDQTEYKIIIPDADSTTYDVKVRNRVVLIVPNSCQNYVTELRILPPYVNGYGGVYYFNDNNLEIAFPYKYGDITVGGGICEEVKRNVKPLTFNQGPGQFAGPC